MAIIILYLLALLPIALRRVAATPPPQEPLFATEGTQLASSEEPANLPLVVWHGLGDKYVFFLDATCCYVHSIQLQS